MTTVSVSLELADIRFIFKHFTQYRQVFRTDWPFIPKTQFEKSFLLAPIFARVSSVDKFLDFDSFGITLQCNYRDPKSGEIVSASLKLILSASGDREYLAYREWVQKIAQPTLELTKSHGTETYFESPTIHYIQMFQGTSPNPFLKFLKQLYELQWIPLEPSKDVHEGLTVVVAEKNGDRRLQESLFDVNKDLDKAKNLEDFLRIYLELCSGINFIHFHQMLYGNLGSFQVTLKQDEQGQLHPLIGDFELMLSTDDDFSGQDSVLRYPGEYRAPSITAKSGPDTARLVDLEESSDSASKPPYKYEKQNREDIFALFILFRNLVELNSEDFPSEDTRIPNILAVIQARLGHDPFDLEQLPLIREWLDIIEAFTKQKGDGRKLVERFSKAQPTFKATMPSIAGKTKIYSSTPNLLDSHILLSKKTKRHII